MLWEVEALKKVGELQPEIIEEILEDLWRRRPELYRSVIINAYIDERINLGKASELLRISRMELEKELKAKGIPVRHLSTEDIIAEVEAIEKW